MGWWESLSRKEGHQFGTSLKHGSILPITSDQVPSCRKKHFSQAGIDVIQFILQGLFGSHPAQRGTFAHLLGPNPRLSRRCSSMWEPSSYV